jgi:hypothetical protein
VPATQRPSTRQVTCRAEHTGAPMGVRV